MANRRPPQSSIQRGKQPNLPKRSTQRQRRESRARREARRTRQLYIGTGIAIGAVVLVLAVGFLTEYVIRPRQVLASVNGTEITRRDYWRARGVQLIDQIDQYQQIAGLVPADQAGQYRQAAASSQAELDDLWGSTGVNEQFLQQMVEDQIYVQYADDLGLEITDDELDQFVLNQFAPESNPLVPPTATPTLIPTRAAWATETAAVAGATDPAGTPAADSLGAGTPVVGTPAATNISFTAPPGDGTPVAGTPGVPASPVAGTPGSGTPGAGTPTAVPPTPNAEEARQTAEAGYRQYRNRTFDTARIDEGEYREWVAEPALARQEVEDYLVSQLGQAAPQISAQHILVSTEDLANQLKTEIDAGADFGAIARAQSTDTSTAPNGGDLGWYSEYDVVDEFWAATSQLQPGQVSAPFQTQYGWHIAMVNDRAEDRPLTDAQLEAARTQVVQDWVAARIAEADVDSDEIEPTPTPGSAQFEPPVNAPPTPTPGPLDGTPAPAATPVAGLPDALATPAGATSAAPLPEPPAAT